MGVREAKMLRLEARIVELIAGIAPLRTRGKRFVLLAGQIRSYDKTDVRAFHSEPAFIKQQSPRAKPLHCIHLMTNEKNSSSLSL